MSNTFFTSDQHFFHKNILQHQATTRKQANVEEMNEAIIKAHNSVVTKHDTIYMLGDVSFGNMEETASVLCRLNGQKILVFGNHDQVIRKKSELRVFFGQCIDYKEIRLDGEKVCMFHFPIESFNNKARGSIHLHGHCHGNTSHYAATMPNRMDIGIDTRLDGSMMPYEWNEVKQLLGR